MNNRWHESDAAHPEDDAWDSDEHDFADEGLAYDADLGESSEDDLIPCSECRAWIHEDSVRCPSCGHYILDGSRYPSRRSPAFQRMFVVIVLVVIAALLLPFLLGLLSMLRAAAG